MRESVAPLVLGHVGCIFEIDSERRFKPLDDKGDKIINIFLPIASDKYLIGMSSPGAQEVESKTLNEAMAKCSYEYFICSESSTEKVTLSSVIGEWSGILSAKELEQLSSEIIRDIEEGLV